METLGELSSLKLQRKFTSLKWCEKLIIQISKGLELLEVGGRIVSLEYQNDS